MLIGIVGKPNVGKSAFFRSLTLADAPSGNFPFTTINPNSGVAFVKVKDPARDFNKVSNPREGYVLGEYRFVPVQVIDVAGLVPGAHEGKGLGNKFLDDLRQADAFIHVIDLSGGTNANGESVTINSYDPANDIKFLEEELNLWFFGVLEKHWISISRRMKQQEMKVEVALASVMTGLNISEKQISQAIIDLKLDKETMESKLMELAIRLREITKPMVIAANKCDVLQDNDLWEKKLNDLKKQFPQYLIVPVMAEYEWNIKQAAKAGILEYIPGESTFTIKDPSKLNDRQKTGLAQIQAVLSKMKSSGIQQCINAAVFDLLKKKQIFPGGLSKLEDSQGRCLPDCFLMDEKATALDFAFRLHTDFGKTFIQAIDVKRRIPVGKDTPLQPGDIIEIKAGK